MSPNFVYHGSSNKRTKSEPIRHKRVRNGEIIFDEFSFHASPEYWIALAYTYTPAFFNFNEAQIYYNIEIDLYENKKEVIIHGINSLQESLKALYKSGGFISTFSNSDFFHMKGLGNLECISDKELRALKSIFIANPVNELKRLGIKFTFIDLSSKKKLRRRNFKR
jgi:hypothetical protein